MSPAQLGLPPSLRLLQRELRLKLGSETASAAAAAAPSGGGVSGEEAQAHAALHVPAEGFPEGRWHQPGQDQCEAAPRGAGGGRGAGRFQGGGRVSGSPTTFTTTTTAGGRIEGGRSVIPTGGG